MMYAYTRSAGTYTGKINGQKVTAHSKPEFDRLARKAEQDRRREQERQARRGWTHRRRK